MTAALDFDALVALISNRFGKCDVPCPLCGPECRSPGNQRRKVMRVWRNDPTFISYYCARCDVHGYATDGTPNRSDRERFERARAEAAQRDRDHAARQLSKAQYLWAMRRPVRDTPAETYLRRARGYGGPIPATLGFLPSKGKFPPAMVAAFGSATELRPGVLAIADADVSGVHITSLKADGSGKAETDRDKIMIGRSLGTPIVLAPVNELGGLAITEGIEDGLSAFEATGLGVWAAGSASRLAALADVIPPYVECVTIIADDDDTGRANAQKLAAAISGEDRDVRLIVPSGAAG